MCSDSQRLPRRGFIPGAAQSVSSGSNLKRAAWLCALLVLAVTAGAASVKSSLLQEDFPFQTAAIGAKFPAKNDANKGVAIRLGNDAALCFDTDLLRVAAGWTGGFITTHGVTYDGAHGEYPSIAGTQKFGTNPNTPGWADASGNFTDARKLEPFGPIPESHGRWDGLYTLGDKVVLSYTVLGTKIYEQPGSVQADGQTGFVRTFKTAKAKSALRLLVCDAEGFAGTEEKNLASLNFDTNALRVTVIGAPKNAALSIQENGRVVLTIPKGAPASLFKVILWAGPTADAGKFAALTAGKPEMIEFAKGGPAHWPEVVTTKGVLGNSDGPYVLDRLTPPVDNPWKRRVRFGGLDFFSDGKRAALSTWDGDVWIVSGIDDKLEHLQWRRFASGGYETLGLKIVNDVIYTTGRDQITRYHDLNNDGEADYYENFNNQATSSVGFHEFQFDLQTDPQGNFYTAKAGPVRGGGSGFGGGGGNGTVTEFAGTVHKISKDGKRREIYATGLRAPNGIGVGPDGQVTTGDNEGTWVPVCPINWVKPGSFLGVEDLAHRTPVPEFKPPLCWIAKNYDNSGGGQVWVTSDKWGPFKGELLHTSYGRCALYLVLKQAVGDQMQGGIVRITGGADAAQFMGYESEIKTKDGVSVTNRSPVKFTSSAMRPKFNPVDGQLYVAGLNGWQSDAAKLTGLDRIRYTGRPVYTARDLQVTKAGLQLTFTQPLDPSSIDPQNFAAERWNYQRTKNYGSPELSLQLDEKGKEKRGHDKVEITGAKLSADGRIVTLAIADLRPVNQMLLKYKLKAKDGTPVAQTIMHTIHRVPDSALAAK